MVFPFHEFGNSPAEVHALVHGLYRGFFNEERKPETHDSEKERHYFRAGYLLGTLFRILLFVTVIRWLDRKL